MEDIINALLDVVRAQHSATEGTEEEPFKMDDIVDMAMNIVGRPDEPAQETEMVDSIQKMVETLAPDIFPPKTFEQMDNSEKAASAVNMIEQRLSRRPQENQPQSQQEQESVQPEPSQASQMTSEDYQGGFVEDTETGDPAELNDLIYKNFMQMMGLQNPQVEFPFDRSQIQYGKEKTVTEMLEEEESNKAEEARSNEQTRRQMSAWELAQNAVDQDESAHEKESYIPEPVAMPNTKSASQLAAEAIARTQEEDKVRLEAEKQAEHMMEEARKRGQDPMAFALHQQEILQYMEKNSDELVSFEDYEDLSPEEKYDIEQKIHIEKQLEAGVSPEDIDEEVPKEYIPVELREEMSQRSSGAQSAQGIPTQEQPVFTEEMLRQLSQEVIRENSDMILADNENEDIDSINEAIFANIKNMMSGSGAAVNQEDVASLIQEVITGNQENETSQPASAVQPPVQQQTAEPKEETIAQASAANTGLHEGMSAVELARAAQKAARPDPQPRSEGKSAVEMAKEAQELARRLKEAQQEPSEQELMEDDFNFDELDTNMEENSSKMEGSDANEADLDSVPAQSTQAETANGQDKEATYEEKDVEAEKSDHRSENTIEAETEAETETKIETEIEDEYEYVDPSELVLGEHTQAEIDEAMENLTSLGLQGDVFERAKRMLLLELAGSESELNAWLKEQENGKKKKATVSALDDEEDLEGLGDLDEDALEKELELAMDEDFILDEELEAAEADEETTAGDESETGEETTAGDESETGEETTAGDESETDEETVAGDEAETGEETTAGDEAETGEETTASEELEIDEETAAGKEAESNEETAAGEKTEVDKETKVDKETEADEETPEEAVAAHQPQVEKTAKENHTKSFSSSHTTKNRRKKNIVKKKEKHVQESKDKTSAKDYYTNTGEKAEEKGYQVSVRNPFLLKNSACYVDKFEEFIVDTQENRKLSTGFKKLDSILRYGLHKGSYFVDSVPQYLKNAFMQQIADRAAQEGVDVLYISTELSRYDLMVETISRLSYEMNGKDADKAVSAMAIMTGEDGADISSLKDELNWFRGRISEHLFILDQEAVAEYTESMEDASAGDILAELIRSIVKEGAHKPVVFIDNIENILSVEDSEDMMLLMEGIKHLAKELNIPIIMSYGYAESESEEEPDMAELEFHNSLGHMCDVYLELKYADMITEDMIELTPEDIEEMAEDGETLLIDVQLHRNRRTMKASCQIQGTPKYNYFEE